MWIEVFEHLTLAREIYMFVSCFKWRVSKYLRRLNIVFANDDVTAAFVEAKFETEYINPHSLFFLESTDLEQMGFARGIVRVLQAALRDLKSGKRPPQ